MAGDREVPISVLVRYFRVPTGGVAVDYPGRDEWSSTITNVSASGVFIRTVRPLPIGTMLHLAFSLPDGQAIDTDAVVRWIAGPGEKKRKGQLSVATSDGMGLEFTNMPRAQEKAMERFVRTFLERMRRR